MLFTGLARCLATPVPRPSDTVAGPCVHGWPARLDFPAHKFPGKLWRRSLISYSTPIDDVGTVSWRYMYQCVRVRQTAGSAREVTGGNRELKVVYSDYVTIKLVKWTASWKCNYANVVIVPRYFQNVSVKICRKHCAASSPLVAPSLW